MVKTFQSEISYEDLKDQIQDFLIEGNYKEVERRLKAILRGGWTDFTAQVLYEERTPLMEQSKNISIEYLETLNLN